jgi:cell division ATPase FtsA
MKRNYIFGLDIATGSDTCVVAEIKNGEIIKIKTIK